MAGAEKIKEKILEEARLQAQKNLEQAEKEAAEIIQSAQKEAEQKKSEIIERAHKEAVDRKKRLIAAAELEARKQKLQAKQEVVEEAFTRVLNKLNSLPADQYQDILVDMVVRSVRKGNEEIIFLCPVFMFACRIVCFQMICTTIHGDVFIHDNVDRNVAEE